MSRETVEVQQEWLETAGTIFIRKTAWDMLLYLKKLLKKQIKIILVHKFWLESIHVTFCARKFYVLEK